MQTASTFTVSGYGWPSALENARTQLRQRIDDIHTITLLKIDLVHSIEQFANIESFQAKTLDRSLHGCTFEKTSACVLLPEQLVAQSLMSKHGELHKRRLFHGEGYAIRAQSQIFAFMTTAFSFTQEACQPLYRGHECYASLEYNTLRQVILRGSAYLKSVVLDNGKFIYSYLPKKDDHNNKYNILRHAGTLYSMLEVYEFEHDPELLIKAELALDYLIGVFAECDNGWAKYPCVFPVEDGFVKLGGVALAMLAICRYIRVTGCRDKIALVEQLANWIANTQDEQTGEFLVHKQSYPSGKTHQFISNYYPGEALFALACLYQLSPDDKWLRMATKGADFIIQCRDKNLTVDTVSHDHWLLYALNEIMRLHPAKHYLDHAAMIAQAMINAQCVTHPEQDIIGGYYSPPRSTPTAIRMEGLSAVYHLFREHGLQSLADGVLDTLALGIRFQCQTQFTPVSAMYLPAPQHAIGGFKCGLDVYEVRIDYVQHNLSSFLAYLKIMNS